MLQTALLPLSDNLNSPDAEILLLEMDFDSTQASFASTEATSATLPMFASRFSARAINGDDFFSSLVQGAGAFSPHLPPSFHGGIPGTETGGSIISLPSYPSTNSHLTFCIFPDNAATNRMQECSWCGQEAAVLENLWNHVLSYKERTLGFIEAGPPRLRCKIMLPEESQAHLHASTYTAPLSLRRPQQSLRLEISITSSSALHAA
ncbi:MAG: hypothetical protein ACLR78_01545 [Roseburia sp.]